MLGKFGLVRVGGGVGRDMVMKGGPLMERAGGLFGLEFEGMEGE